MARKTSSIKGSSSNLAYLTLPEGLNVRAPGGFYLNPDPVQYGSQVFVPGQPPSSSSQKVVPLRSASKPRKS